MSKLTYSDWLVGFCKKPFLYETCLFGISTRNFEHSTRNCIHYSHEFRKELKSENLRWKKEFFLGFDLPNVMIAGLSVYDAFGYSLLNFNPQIKSQPNIIWSRFLLIAPMYNGPGCFQFSSKFSISFSVFWALPSRKLRSQYLTGTNSWRILPRIKISMVLTLALTTYALLVPNNPKGVLRHPWVITRLNWS